MPVRATLAVLVLAAASAAQRGDHAPVRAHGEAGAVAPSASAAPRGGARPAIVLTGYWPPSNEAVRRFSTDPVQNPQGWIGADWEGRGYDVHAYFPEFDPPNCGDCGKGEGDLEVDYQDTSADFWPLAEALAPVAIVTFSRGLPDASWEVELNQFNKANWIRDFEDPLVPTPAPPDGSVPAGFLRPSNLPVDDIVDAVLALELGIDAYVCVAGDGGGFLSEFVAYHGVWYRDLHDDPRAPDYCVAAGHVHVGDELSNARARAAAKATLREVIELLDAVLPAEVCQPDLGFGGPGAATLSLCGEPLATGATAQLLLSGAAPLAPAFLAVGAAANPTPFKGGQLVPVPALLVLPLATDARGALLLPSVPGGGGPAIAVLQAVVVDPAQPQGFGLSNALEVALLP